MHYTHTAIRYIHSSIYPVNYVTQSLVLRPFSIKCNLKPSVVQKPGPIICHGPCSTPIVIYNYRMIAVAVIIMTIYNTHTHTCCLFLNQMGNHLTIPQTSTRISKIVHMFASGHFFPHPLTVIAICTFLVQYALWIHVISVYIPRLPNIKREEVWQEPKNMSKSTVHLRRYDWKTRKYLGKLHQITIIPKPWNL